MKTVEILCLLALITPHFSIDGDSIRTPGDYRKLPRNVFTICSTKNAGESVDIQTSDGITLKATCQPMQGRLVAIPEWKPIPTQSISKTAAQ